MPSKFCLRNIICPLEDFFLHYLLLGLWFHLTFGFFGHLESTLYGAVGAEIIYGSPGSRSGEGNGTPLQSSCLENAMDGGAW